MSAQPDVVWDRAQNVISVIDVKDSAEPVLQIVTAARIQGHSINVEPSTPEGPCEEVYVAVDKPSCIVPKGHVNLGLDIEIDDGQDAAMC